MVKSEQWKYVMPKLRKITLTQEEREELEKCRNTSVLPYMRERSAALLKIANGELAAHIARNGLLRPHDPDVIYEWIKRYEENGLSGLLIRKGRGRKPAFPPSGTF